VELRLKPDWAWWDVAEDVLKVGVTVAEGLVLTCSGRILLSTKGLIGIVTEDVVKIPGFKPGFATGLTCPIIGGVEGTNALDVVLVEFLVC